MLNLEPLTGGVVYATERRPEQKLWISGMEIGQNAFRVTKFWDPLECPHEISSQNRKFFFFTIVEIKDKRASVTQMQNTDLSKR
jgi:hypothetical protein